LVSVIRALCDELASAAARRAISPDTAEAADQALTGALSMLVVEVARIRARMQEGVHLDLDSALRDLSLANHQMHRQAYAASAGGSDSGADLVRAALAVITCLEVARANAASA
jgi:hypothetical protein